MVSGEGAKNVRGGCFSRPVDTLEPERAWQKSILPTRPTTAGALRAILVTGVARVWPDASDRQGRSTPAVTARLHDRGMTRTLRLLPLLAAAGLIASACGDASADELGALQAESSATITQLETDLTARDETITELSADLTSLETASTEEATALSGEVATLTASLAAVAAERDEALTDAAEASAREQELLNTYDAEIRGETQAAMR